MRREKRGGLRSIVMSLAEGSNRERPGNRVPADLRGKLFGVVVALAFIVAIGYVDVATGPLAMSLFYIVPVLLTAWWFGFRAASIVTIAATAAWLWSDLMQETHDPSISYWNAFTRFVIFGSMGWFGARLRRDRIRMTELNAQLEESLERESKSARRDEVSGLPNSRAFEETLSRELARSRREGAPIGVGYVDLDNFKRVNDTHGHWEGDELLRRVAQALFISVREEDSCARLGGDEFGLILVQPELATYDSVATRIYARIEELATMYVGLGFGATIGFVHFKEAPASTIAALHAADQVMYRLKSQRKGTFSVEEHGFPENVTRTPTARNDGS